MKLIQAANQHQDCDALTQQIMDLRKQKRKYKIVKQISRRNSTALMKSTNWSNSTNMAWLILTRAWSGAW